MVAMTVLVAGALAAARPVVAGVTGEIVGPGASSYPIAIVPLRDPGGTEGARFADVLGNDLTLSGYFRVLDRDAYIDDPQLSGLDVGEIEFLNWSTIGALALVKGSLQRTPEGIVVEVRLFDVQGKRALSVKRYRVAQREFPRAAHRFADEILRVFTGTQGPFDTQIAFVSGGSGFGKDVYTITFDQLAPQRVTNERGLIIAPSWNPDARRIVFSSYRGGKPGLYEVEAETGKGRGLVSAGGLAAGGVWSPDGSLLATTREIDGNPEIVLVRPDGKVARRVTQHPAIDVSPTWSPDGRELAFCSDRLGTPQIFIAESGGGVRRVTYEGSYNTSPAWSPKGDEIAYTGRVNGRFQIFVVDLRGQAPRQITRSPGNNEDPRWSPDSRYLVFASTRAGGSHVFFTDRTGRIQKQLTHGGRNDTSPAWSSWRRD
jgi:TolB protein